MARAAAKRRQPTRHHHDDRRHKDAGGQRFEDTLFFNRLRKRAKWVFIFLAVVFGLGFVLFGVGSSVGGGGGLSDIFNGIRGGGSGQTSVEKAQKATQKDPKDAKAWHDLATAYETKGDNAAAISAWTTYTTLRPKDADGLQSLASAYEQQFSNQTQVAAAAQADAQNAQATNFGPPATSPLGRALGSIQDPIGQAVSATANQQFNDALSARQATAQQLVDRPAAPRAGRRERGRRSDRDRRVQEVPPARPGRPECGLRAPADQGARLGLSGLDSRGAEIRRTYCSRARGDQRVNFDINTEQLEGDRYVISLAGEVDLYTAPEFKAQLLDVIGKGGKQVIVDFTDTTFIDSTTLGVLVGGVKRLRTNDGELSLVCSDRNITKIFEITGLDRVFTIYPTRAEALEQIGASGSPA
jgi:anti-sigma B factor antagonist